MVPLIVFYLHIVFLSAAFTRRYQEGGWTDGSLAVGFIALLFFVGWAISSLLVKLVLDQEGLGPLLDRDSVSLLVLTLGEAILYYFLLRDEVQRPLKEDSTAAGN